MGDALAIGRDGGGVETLAPVPHEQHDGAGLDLGVERDLRGLRPFGGVDRGLPGRIEEGAEAFGEGAVPHHHHLDGDPVIGLDVPLEEADALGQVCHFVAEGAGRPALEQPGPQLSFLGPGQAHHVLRVLGRALDQCERLQHRVVHVCGHLAPLLGQRPRLAFGHQVAHQAEPPGPEDEHDGGDDQQGAAERAQGGGAGMAQDQHDDAPGGESGADRDAQDQLPASGALVPDAEHGDEVVLHPHPLGLTGVTPDQDGQTGGQEHRPAEDPDEADVEERDDDLAHDHERDDGDEQADAPTVGDGPGEDVRGLRIEGHDQPRQGVDQHGEAGEQAEEDDADPQEIDVDARPLRDPGADARQDTTVGRAAYVAQVVVVVQPSTLAAAIVPTAATSVGPGFPGVGTGTGTRRGRGGLGRGRLLGLGRGRASGVAAGAATGAWRRPGVVPGAR